MRGRRADTRGFRGVVAGLRAEDPRWFHAHGGLLRPLPGRAARRATCAAAAVALVWGALGAQLPLIFVGIVLAMLWGTWRISGRSRRDGAVSGHPPHGRRHRGCPRPSGGPVPGGPPPVPPGESLPGAR